MAKSKKNKPEELKLELKLDEEDKENTECPECGSEMEEINFELMEELFIKLGKAVSAVFKKREKAGEEEDSGDAELLFVLTTMSAELAYVMGIEPDVFADISMEKYFEMSELYGEDEELEEKEQVKEPSELN